MNIKKIAAKKEILTVLLSLTVIGCLAGCGSTDRTENDSGTLSRRNEKIYNGQTVIHSPRGSWTPPKGSRRLENGTIVDSQGVVIGNDGTWHDDGKGVG